MKLGLEGSLFLYRFNLLICYAIGQNKLTHDWSE